MARSGIPIQRSVRRIGHQWIRRSTWSLNSIGAALGLFAALAVGAWWTGMAVHDGAVVSTVIRFCLSIVGGMYYLALFRIATGTIAIRRSRKDTGWDIGRGRA